MFEGGSRRGIDGYRAWIRDGTGSAEYTSTVETVYEIDAERVLAITPTTFHFKLSGVTLEHLRLACVVTVRAGRIVRTEAHPSEEEALEAVRSGE